MNEAAVFTTVHLLVLLSSLRTIHTGSSEGGVELLAWGAISSWYYPTF